MEELKKELLEIGSSLDPRDKQDAWNIPDGYFDRLQSKVLADIQLSAKHANPSLRNRFRMGLYTISGIAAMLVLAIGWWYFNKPSQKFDPAGIQSLDQELVYSYLEDNIDELSLDMLATENHLEDELLIDQPQNEQEWDILLEDVDIQDIEHIF
jgi:hypothetical protein